MPIPVTDRARMLGHSAETNLRHYSFAGKDNINDLKALINGQVKKRYTFLSSIVYLIIIISISSHPNIGGILSPSKITELCAIISP